MTRPRLLTVRGAAERVGRSPRTIQRWIEDGLPTIAVPPARGRKVVQHYVDEQKLLEWFREVLATATRHADE